MLLVVNGSNNSISEKRVPAGSEGLEKPSRHAGNGDADGNYGKITGINYDNPPDKYCPTRRITDPKFN